MKRYFLIGALLCAFSVTMSAGELRPQQQQALDRMLESVPPEYREMMRPQFEAVIAMATDEQLAQVLQEYSASADDADTPEEPTYDADEGAAPDDGWGGLEPRFEQAFAGIQDYIIRVANRHAAMNRAIGQTRRDLEEEWRRLQEYGLTDAAASSACSSKLVDLPGGGTEDFHDQGGYVMQIYRAEMRQMAELRANYGSLEGYARAVGVSLDAELVQNSRRYFSSPGSVEAVFKAFDVMHARMTELVESSSREKQRIERTRYPDARVEGEGVYSEMKVQALRGLERSTREQAEAVCSGMVDAYYAGLAGFIEPLVPELRRQIQ